MAKRNSGSNPKEPQWTFLTNHFHVLRCLSGAVAIPLREVAQQVGITERAVQKIVLDLESAGYITRSKVGRQNSYRINVAGRLRHTLDAGNFIGPLLELLSASLPKRIEDISGALLPTSKLRISIR